MPVQNYILLTPSQRDDAIAYNSPEAQVDPRVVDGVSPGLLTNLNASSLDFTYGEDIPLTGMYLAPKQILDDPAYIGSVPGMVSYLSDKPFGMCEDEVVFLFGQAA